MKPYTYYQNYYRIYASNLNYASMLVSIGKCRAIKIFICGSGLVHRVTVTGHSHQKQLERPRRPNAIHFQCMLATRSDWSDRWRERRDFSKASDTMWVTKVDRCSTLCKWAAAQPWRQPIGGWPGFRRWKKVEMPAAWKTCPSVTLVASVAATQATAAMRCERPEPSQVILSLLVSVR